MKQRTKKRNLSSMVKAEIYPKVEYKSFTNYTIDEKEITECFAPPFLQNKKKINPNENTLKFSD